MVFVYRVLPFQYSPKKTVKCAAPQVRNPRKHWCTSTIACIVYSAGGIVPSSCIVPVKLLGTTGDRYILLIVPRIGIARGAQKKNSSTQTGAKRVTQTKQNKLQNIYVHFLDSHRNYNAPIFFFVWTLLGAWLRFLLFFARTQFSAGVRFTAGIVGWHIPALSGDHHYCVLIDTWRTTCF